MAVEMAASFPWALPGREVIDEGSRTFSLALDGLYRRPELEEEIE